MYRLIAAIIKRGKADDLIDAAKQAGVTGATIFFARGTSIHEPNPFLGIRLTSEREVVFMVVKQENAEDLLERLVQAGELDQPGNGIAFMFPLESVRGIVHLERKRE